MTEKLSYLKSGPSHWEVMGGWVVSTCLKKMDEKLPLCDSKTYNF